MSDKASLRTKFRKLRAEHASAIADNIRALLFRHPPAPLMEIVPSNAIIGLYIASEHEAPAAGYARYFSEAGHKIALPRFSAPKAAMQFAEHSDPFGEVDLEPGPYGLRQPNAEAALAIPNVVFVPLLGFTQDGERLGQGGGHYDRWLADNPAVTAIGMAWDCQLVDELPVEPHDMKMTAIVTPTRLYGPF